MAAIGQEPRLEMLDLVAGLVEFRDRRPGTATGCNAKQLHRRSVWRGTRAGLTSAEKDRVVPIPGRPTFGKPCVYNCDCRATRDVDSLELAAVIVAQPPAIGRPEGRRPRSLDDVDEPSRGES